MHSNVTKKRFFVRNNFKLIFSSRIAKMVSSIVYVVLEAQPLENFVKLTYVVKYYREGKYWQIYSPNYWRLKFGELAAVFVIKFW